MTALPKLPMPHVGLLLKTYFKNERIYKAALARVMDTHKSGIQRYLSRPSLQVAILWELSLALKHNFLMDLAAQLPPGFSTDAPDPTLPLQERIAALEEENRLLNAKVETLMAVVRK
ncbi:MAG: hypothetical protein JJE55_05600 [Flavobacteriaceae bacterium]|nr:hypothetical protein [Flavobacteriaceae bacterium]